MAHNLIDDNSFEFKEFSSILYNATLFTGDLNDCTTPGVYYCGSGTANRPGALLLDDNETLLLFVFIAGSHIVQIGIVFFASNTSSIKLWSRYSSSQGEYWSSWV